MEAWLSFLTKRSESNSTEASGGASSTMPPVESVAESGPQDDYSAFAMEEPSQFSMAWTTFEDGFRKGYPHIAQYTAAIADPQEATRQFWPRLRNSALPYNLLVLKKLNVASASAFQNNFEGSWLPEYDEFMQTGRLYGIDMTIFSDLKPQQVSNGTVRYTPSTMTLLQMDDQKNLNPLAVFVSDPTNVDCQQIYTPSSPAWIYGLLAAQTSLTVHGIWLGHVYTLHLVTAAMQMTMLNTLPATNIVSASIWSFWSDGLISPRRPLSATRVSSLRFAIDTMLTTTSLQRTLRTCWRRQTSWRRTLPTLRSISNPGIFIPTCRRCWDSGR
jgi:hypothetical protein